MVYPCGMKQKVRFQYRPAKNKSYKVRASTQVRQQTGQTKPYRAKRLTKKVGY